MKLSKSEIHKLMDNPLYPLSGKYDKDWIIDGVVGSHSLWLLEALTRQMHLKAGMRVLDVGCGKAAGSIFLAKEYGVNVIAADLRSPTENYRRIYEAGVSDKVIPLYADGQRLPFADDYFDAVIGINSVQFFGLEKEYFKTNFVRHVKPGGQIGLVLPGFYHELGEKVPDYLWPHVEGWYEEYKTWQSVDWWNNHLSYAGNVDIRLIDTFGGNEGNIIYGKSTHILNGDDEDGFYDADAGRNITFIRVVMNRIK